MYAVAYNWVAVNKAIRSERARVDWSRGELAKRAGLSLGTIKNLEGDRDYKRIPVEALRSVEDAFGWEPGVLEAKLRDPAATGEPETRYRRQPMEAGQIIDIVEDAVYAMHLAAPAGTTFAQYDAAREAAFDVLRKNGIEVATRNPRTSPGRNEDS